MLAIAAKESIFSSIKNFSSMSAFKPDSPINSCDEAVNTCLPEEQFLLIQDHEIQAKYRYRGLELSFLTFSPVISRLMAVLGIEAEQSLSRLAEVARQLDLKVEKKEADSHGVIPAELHSQHFFIVDETIALRALYCSGQVRADTFSSRSRQFDLPRRLIA
ncbi:hypothetical protein R5M92_09350 [Halomonas sp. Bachu 37]|uniref:hypothetical protein n=1 Tax=Halomonas kashgarensis TaxID=3084920 RepID=UPI0032168C07